MFDPTYRFVDEREPWTNEIYNTTVAEMVAYFSNLDGPSFAAPLTLSRSSQDLIGGQHSIFGFRKWLGYGTANVCIRDVTGFGAKGDGGTDDLAAIQAAIDDLPSTGGTIVFPPGTYAVSGTILMPGTARNKSRVTLIGSGPGTTIRRLANGPDGAMLEMGALDMGTSDQAIIGLQFDGNRLNQGAGTSSQTCVSLANTTRARMVDVVCHDSKFDGVHVFGSTDATIHHCSFHTNDRHGIYQGNVDRSCTGLQVLDCNFSSNIGSGIKIGPTERTQVCDCTFSTNGDDGILVETISPLSSRAVQISDCSIVDSTHNGIHVRDAFGGTAISDIGILGNNISGCLDNGILLESVTGSSVNRFTISGNQCSGNGLSGINLTGNVRDGVVSENICANNFGGSFDNGGIRIQGLNDDENARHISIMGNSCLSDGSESPQVYGILLKDQTQDNAVVGNVLFGNTEIGIQDLGDDNDVGHNPGYGW